MARPLRVEYPRALYHVMNRGNQRQDVFRSPRDYETFLEKLEMFSESYLVDVYCYCLMSNHFHLLLRTRETNLSKFMQVLLTSFTVTLNRRNNKTGHIFHGRYKGHLIESREYLSILSKYIHLNPVRIKKQRELPVAEKKRLLTSYQWSSYQAYIGLKEKPRFLEIKPVLSSWGNKLSEQMKAYRSYIENGLYKSVDNPFDLAIRQQIIGSETFAEKVARKHLLKRDINDPLEQREVLKARRVIPPDEIIHLTAKAFGTGVDKVVARKGKHCQARKIAMFLCCKHCVSKHSLTDIAKMFSVTICGLTKMREIMKRNQTEKVLKKIYEIESKIAST